MSDTFLQSWSLPGGRRLDAYLVNKDTKETRENWSQGEQTHDQVRYYLQTVRPSILYAAGQ